MLNIEKLRRAATGNEYVSPARICLTADGELTDQDDPRAVSLLVGAGSTLPVEVARRYGLIRDEAHPEASGPFDAEPSEATQLGGGTVTVTDGLDGLTVKALTALATDRGLQVSPRARKDELIAALRAADPPTDAAADEGADAEQAAAEPGAPDEATDTAEPSTEPE